MNPPSSSAVERVRVMCAERLEKQVAVGPLSPGYDLDTYRAGEIEGWRTCLRVLADVPSTHTPAQAMYALAGYQADFSSQPTHRTLYDRERGFMDSRDSGSWLLAWNRVISRVQGWLEAEYGPAEYENTKDLPRPPLPLIDFSKPANKKDLEDSMNVMLGKESK